MKCEGLWSLNVSRFLLLSFCFFPLSYGKGSKSEEDQARLLKKILKEMQIERRQSSRVIQQLQRQVQSLSGQVQRLEQAVRSSMAPKRKLSIPSFEIEGSNLGKNVLETALEPLTRRKISVQEVQTEVKRIVQEIYKDQGVRGVQVIIPPQEISDKPFSVEVIEPRLGAVEITGNKYFSENNIRRFFVGKITDEDDVFNADKMEAQLDKANRHPDRQITAILQPGEEPGLTHIILDVKEREPFYKLTPFHYVAEVNNTGTPNVGRIRFQNTFQYTNFFNRDHTGTIQWIFNPDDFDDVQVVSGSYLIPQFLPNAPIDLSLALYGGYSNVTSDTVVDTLSIVGEGFTAGGQVSWRMKSYKGLESTLSVGMEITQLDNSLRFGTFSTIDSTIGMLPVYLRYNFQYRDVWGATLGRVSIRENLSSVVSNGDTQDFAAFREGSQVDYTVFRFGLERYQKLFKGWTLFARAEGQFTNDRLIPSEQFRLGGANTVRGYEQSEISGDRSVFIRTELRSPALPPFFTRLEDFVGKQEELQFVVFVDAGKAFTIDATPGDPSSEDISGAGVGFRYQFLKSFFGSLDIAWPFEDAASTRSGEPSVHFKAVLTF